MVGEKIAEVNGYPSFPHIGGMLYNHSILDLEFGAEQ